MEAEAQGGGFDAILAQAHGKAGLRARP